MLQLVQEGEGTEGVSRLCSSMLTFPVEVAFKPPEVPSDAICAECSAFQSGFPPVRTLRTRQN